MRFHVITRCTRVENLLTIADSVYQDGVDVLWHVVFDTSVLKDIDTSLLEKLYSRGAVVHFKKGYPGSYMYPQMNEIIESLPMYEWYTLIDDDNIIHQDYYSELTKAISKNPSCSVFCYNQLVDVNQETYRIASPANTIVGGIDLAQFTFQGAWIHEQKFEGGYCGDGEFISGIHKKYPDSFKFINKILCYYNYLQQIGIKKSSAPKVLYIGEDKPELKSNVYLGYEDTSLNVEYASIKDLIYNDYDLSKYDSIVSSGGDWKDVPLLPSEHLSIRKRWVHEDNPNGELAYNVAMNSILNDYKPRLSYFTPAYKTPIDRIYRLYTSLQLQTADEWEWVIVNDSPNDKPLSDFLKKMSSSDSRVKVYTFEEPSNGCIGDVKYKAAVLCSGELLAELDHDDYLMSNCTRMLIQAMDKNKNCGFFYTNCVELDDNGNSLTYPDGFAFGYGSYRNNNGWNESVCVGINPKTIRHIVGVPNHIRAWRRNLYFAIGGHNRRLTIADDYELIVRTFLKTKFCHIDALGYIQYIYNNNSGQNTHNATRGDIQRRVRTIANHYNHEISERFHQLGVKDWAYEYNPSNPLLAPSRFGDEENSVNVVFVPNL